MKRPPRPRVTDLPYCRWRWPAEQRLAHYTKRDPLSGCLLWQGALGPSGYGQMTFRNRSYRTHRLAWIIKHGPIPPGLNVCHRCDERRCVNTSHLFLGSPSANMVDLKMKTGDWYGAMAAKPEPKARQDLDDRAAAIRIRYRGFELFGKVGIRRVEPDADFPSTARHSGGARGSSRGAPARSARRPGSSRRGRSGRARAGGS